MRTEKKKANNSKANPADLCLNLSCDTQQKTLQHSTEKRLCAMEEQKARKKATAKTYCRNMFKTESKQAVCDVMLSSDGRISFHLGVSPCKIISYDINRVIDVVIVG